MSEKKICMIDIDGTLLESYKNIYNEIIIKLFGKNKLIMRINSIFFKINDLDIISNNIFIFNIIMLIYSILSFTKFSENIKKYEQEYINMSKDEIISNYIKIIIPIEEKGYTVYLITHDDFATRFKVYIPATIVNANKTLFVLRNMSKLNLEYIIGNNLFDDIVPFVLINAIKSKRNKRKITPIYIGNSKLVLTVTGKKSKHFKNLDDMLSYILNGAND